VTASFERIEIYSRKTESSGGYMPQRAKNSGGWQEQRTPVPGMLRGHTQIRKRREYWLESKVNENDSRD